MFKKENFSFSGGKDMPISPNTNVSGEVFIKKFAVADTRQHPVKTKIFNNIPQGGTMFK
jgi:hypothetical protein